MKRRLSLLWIYIMLGVMFLEMMFVLLCVFTPSPYIAGESLLAVPLLYQMIRWWKYSFTAVLLASFCRMKRQPVHTAKEFLQSVMLLVIVLGIKILYDTLLLTVSGSFYIGFSLEYLWICFSRMAFYMGVPGLLALVIGILCAVLPFRGMGYALAGLTVVFFTTIVQDYWVYYFNYYHPCPIKNPFVLERQVVYGSAETYGGSKYEEYEGERQEFSVDEYDLTVWIDKEHVISGKAAMTLSDSSLSRYIFRLNAYMNVESVEDGKGNPLKWEHSGNYVTVFNDEGTLQEIVMVYYCDDGHIIPMEHHYVSLPSYLMWYPAAPDMQSNYNVNVHFAYKVYCNLESQGRNCFEGNSHTVSLLSGSLIKETDMDGVRIIYPGANYREEYIRQRYLLLVIQMAQREGNDMEGFDWFMDDWSNLSFWQYYDTEECYSDAYIY